MKRWFLGLALVAACGGRSASGPAWPKAAESEEDGGESLEPQHASNVAAVERAEDRTPAVDATVVVMEEKPPAKPDGAKPEVAKPPETAKPPEGEVQIEVIEIRPEDIPVNP